MSKPPPWAKIWMSDYDAQTNHLSLVEDAIYWRLLRVLWASPGCSMPNDVSWIARRLRLDPAEYAQTISSILKEFFCIRKDRIIHEQLHADWLHAWNKCMVAAENGSKGGKAKALKDKKKTSSKGHVKQLAIATELEPEQETEKDSDDDNIVRIAPRTSEESINEFRQRNRL